MVITNDNPRHEDAVAIVGAILTGMDRPEAATIELNRARAIAWAIRQAASEDIVLVAGKGHESYQQVGDKRLPFDDRAEVSIQLDALLAEVA